MLPDLGDVWDRRPEDSSGSKDPQALHEEPPRGAQLKMLNHVLGEDETRLAVLSGERLLQVDIQVMILPTFNQLVATPEVKLLHEHGHDNIYHPDGKLNVRGPPTFLFMQTNKRCNLRCGHCTFWKLDDDDRARYLSWDMKMEILDEFKEIGGQTLVTCGGEPMLDVDDYFRLCTEAKARGLKMFSVVNGTKIKTIERAERMVSGGPTEITVSVDSHVEKIHDRVRGVRGSFKMAVSALRLMIEARRKMLAVGLCKCGQSHESHLVVNGYCVPKDGSCRCQSYSSRAVPKIYAMTIVCERNYRDLDRFYDFVLNDIGADKLKLNIMQPTFGQVTPSGDEFFETEQVKDPENLAKVINECNDKYKLGINGEWLRQVKMYFSSIAAGKTAKLGWLSPNGTDEPICNTYDRNIMLDVYGKAQLCFADDYGGMNVEKPGDLRKFWYEFSPPIRDKMLTCTRYCGISHSVRRESATIRRPSES